MNDLQPGSKFSNLFRKNIEGLPFSVRSNKILEDFKIPASCFIIRHSQQVVHSRKVRVTLRIFILVILELSLAENPCLGDISVRNYFLVAENMDFIDILAQRIRKNASIPDFKLFYISAKPQHRISKCLAWEYLANYLQSHFLNDIEVFNPFNEESLF